MELRKKQFIFKAESGEENPGYHFSGYGSTYGNEDRDGDVILAGAFDEFLKTGYDLDSPESFYVDELRENLIALKKGETVLGRKYQPDGTGISKKDALEYSPNKIVIVEGTISALDELRDLFDATIYVQTDDETRKERYIQRALKERNQDEKGALEQWNYIYKAGEKYVQPLKDKCDIIVNGEFDEEYVEEIAEKLTP